jgi:hypothetical protein
MYLFHWVADPRNPLGAVSPPQWIWHQRQATLQSRFTGGPWQPRDLDAPSAGEVPGAVDLSSAALLESRKKTGLCIMLIADTRYRIARKGCKQTPTALASPREELDAGGRRRHGAGNT